jgi:hypothetical protein
MTKPMKREHGERGTIHAPAGIVLRRRFAAGGFRRIGTWVERADEANRSHEAIAFAYHGFEKAWFGRMVAQGSANFSNYIIDVPFRINEEIGVPQLGNDLLPGNELAAAANQEDQKIHGLFLEAHFAAVEAKLIAAQIQFDIGYP